MTGTALGAADAGLVKAHLVMMVVKVREEK
jgi:hypothetical protein